jgi:RiboL-PSP-HEPN
MDKRTKDLISEIDKFLETGEVLIAYGKSNPGETKDEIVKELTGWATRLGELLNRIYPHRNSEYQKQYARFREHKQFVIHSGYYKHVTEMCGVLTAVKYELENGLLDNLKSLIQADIFANFLEMGEHLLKEGYKDAAAVIIGSVLEDTLRKLCEANNIKTINDKGKKLTIDPLNVELEKIGVYNPLVKKQITSWADLRNNAAHGHYDQYDIKQVQTMLQFVESFSSDYLK